MGSTRPTFFGVQGNLQALQARAMEERDGGDKDTDTEQIIVAVAGAIVIFVLVFCNANTTDLWGFEFAF